MRPEIPPPFEVSELTQGTTCTLTVRGDVDLASAPRLGDALAAVLRAEPEIVLLDLGQVEFIDSTGLHVILSARARAEDHGIRLVVVESEAARRLFAVSGVRDLLTIADSDGQG